MVRKQLLWRGSNTWRIFISLLLLTISFSVQSMETYQSFKKQESSIDNTDAIERKSSQSKTKSNYFHGKSYEELNLVFEHAPWKAKEIVDHLKNPDALGEPEYRAAIFKGKP